MYGGACRGTSKPLSDSQVIPRTWRRTLRRWWYTLVDAPRALGRPQTIGEWDAQYHAGGWTGLESGAQVAHYAAIVGYVQHLYPEGASVVDVGCGHGVLFRQLRWLPLRSYVGFDLSATAIAQAAPLVDERARFEVGNFETWSAHERPDVIIFNESIAYTRRPLAVLERYVGMLAEGGCFIVSTTMNSMNRVITRRIRRRFGAAHTTRVENEHGERWEINVLGPSRALALRRS